MMDKKDQDLMAENESLRAEIKSLKAKYKRFEAIADAEAKEDKKKVPMVRMINGVEKRVDAPRRDMRTMMANGWSESK